MTAGTPRRPRRRTPPSASPRGKPEEEKLRRERALEEALDVRPLPRAPFPTLEVRNPERRTRYRLLLPAYPSPEAAACTCPDFARRAVGTCKHLEAGWIYLRAHPIPQPYVPPATGMADDLWQAFDRRRAEAHRKGESTRRAIRDAGALLIEMAPGD